MYRYTLLVGIFAISHILLGAPKATAQNTGGVSSPVINAGHSAAQYRATYAADSEGFAQRVHYESALDGSRMVRVIAATRKTSDGDVDFDYVEGELFWQISDDAKFWQTGLRFDGRIRGDDRPGSVGINWLNQWTLANGITTRFTIIASANIGNDATDDIFLRTRGGAMKSLDNGASVGIEFYNSYGAASQVGDFDGQSHTIGPALTIPIGKDLSIYTGAQFGVTKAAENTALRFRLIKKF
jgi:hypothetical protein